MRDLNKFVELKVLGQIPAGKPDRYTQDVIGNCKIPETDIEDGSEYFILQVTGDSMINADIMDGDWVLIKSTTTAPVGSIVVALDNEGLVTLKRLEMDKDGRYYLHPENPAYEDIYKDEIHIQGIACNTIKRNFMKRRCN